MILVLLTNFIQHSILVTLLDAGEKKKTNKTPNTSKQWANLCLKNSLGEVVLFGGRDKSE